MPMSSQEIAGMSAAFNQQLAMQAYNSTMVSQLAGGHMSQGQMAERGVGSAINRGMAVGMPMAGLGASLMGVDPMGMAFRGGAAGWGMGSALTGGTWAGAIGGGALGATAIGLPVAAGAAAMQYGAHHMMVGAGQQQMLNQTLRGSFGHIMNNQGGRGFSSGDMADIGQQFRGMTQQRGAAGEFTSMDELGRLAANMGRMGMDTGVRNAKEFQEKFQKMMTSVKEIAKTFSTSLEDAQKTMSGMRMSGVFHGQAGFAKMMHGAATGGNLAMSEVSAMSQIGSQLSRAIGGRGVAGAMAGVTAIGRVGAAQQAGVLSDEDVYNTTGLRGAEGRQAYAAQMLEGDAQFFKSSRGRRVLAAVAGKNGSIDEQGVQDFLSGSVDIGEMSRRSGANLQKVGRANFIRNEGKMRGEAMRAFGGMARISTYKGWLKGKGIGLDEDDDRGMLFLQRQTGMDEDQASTALKMMRGMDAITDQQSTAGIQDNIMRNTEKMRRHNGIEGIKHKFEDVKNKIDGHVQQAGARAYGSLVQYAESVLDGYFGRANEYVYKDLARDVRMAAQGQSKSRADFGASIGGHGGGHEDHNRAHNWSALNAGRMANAGYSLGNTSDMGAIRAQMDSYQAATTNFNRGGSDSVRSLLSGGAGGGQGAKNALVRDMLMNGGWQGSGAAGMANLANFTRRAVRGAGSSARGLSDADLAGAANASLGFDETMRMPSEYSSGYGAGISPEKAAHLSGAAMMKYDRGETVAAYREKVGVGSFADWGSRVNGMQDLMQYSDTEQAYQRSKKKDFRTGGKLSQRTLDLEAEGNWQLTKGIVKRATGGVAGAIGEAIFGSHGDKEQAFGNALARDDIKSLRSSVFGASTDEARQDVSLNIAKRMRGLEGKSGDAAEGERRALQSLGVMSTALGENGNKMLTGEQLSDFYSKNKDSLKKTFKNKRTFMGAMGHLAESEGADRDAAYDAYTREVGSAARRDNKSLQLLGLRGEKGEMTGAAADVFKGGIKGLSDADSKAMVHALTMREQDLAKSDQGDGSDKDVNAAGLKGIEGWIDSKTDSMDFGQKRAFAKQLAGSGRSDMASRLNRRLNFQERLAEGDKRGGSAQDIEGRRMRALAGSIGLSTEGVSDAKSLLTRVDAAMGDKSSPLDAKQGDRLKELIAEASKTTGRTPADREKLSKIQEKIAVEGAGLAKHEKEKSEKESPSYKALDNIKSALDLLNTNTLVASTNIVTKLGSGLAVTMGK